MDNFTLSTTTTKATSILNSSAVQSLCLKQSKHFTFAKKPRKISVFAKKPRNFSVFAAKDESQIDQWDQMELKFGRMIGEDPKLTLAKIMGRKSDPEVSYMEIEKNFERNKGKKVYDIEEVPFNVSDEKKSSNSLDGLNLVRPVPKKGVKFEVDNKPPSQPSQPGQPSVKSFENVKSSVPNVILRKPSLYNEDDEDLSRVRIKPNMSLTIGKVTPERFTDMTLLKRPEPATIKPEEKPEAKENEESKYTLLEKPSTSNEQEEEIVSTIKSEDNVLLGKPQRLEQLEKATQNINTKDEIPITPEIHDNAIALTNFLTSPQLKEHEDNDWNKAEELVKTGGREEVELISSSTRGFAVSFGSLIGFLPYRNLGAKWKFLAFESWLRKKGLDPSVYRQNLGVIGTFDSTSTIPSLESRLDPQKDDKTDQEISSDMKLDELFVIYDQEKLKFLSSFIGQRIKVSVVLADRISRKLIFSTKPKEKEEILGKKRALMAKLSVGDVVKCCIKKITYFGIFVEIEGVPALIHQTEVSWDATLDPASYFKIGQIVEAKVHQLDFSLERIFLSLKEITPDPLMETLEAVVGEHAFYGELEAAEETDTEWAEVESLIQELQQFKGIQSVSKGRYFLSPGLAPTFQVYMAAMFEDQYKLLARSGNRIQEVMVQTSLSKEEIKSAILTCTSRVV